MKSIIYSTITLLTLLTNVLLAQEAQYSVKDHFKDIKTSDLMLLGTFHFANPGLDTYKTKYEIDILSSKKQAELSQIINTIIAYAPTKIAVEARKENQSRVDSLYNEYLSGNFNLPKNEIYQIGFRAAKSLGHKKVYAVDARARRFQTNLSDKELQEKRAYFFQKAGNDVIQRENFISQKFQEMYTFEDNLKTKIPLLDYFVFMNEPENFKVGHGNYLIGSFKMGEGKDYFGADNAIWWYSRNLRIFHNLLQINKAGKDRILLLIGAGHLPILDFLADTSVDFNKKDFKDFIKK